MSGDVELARRLEQLTREFSPDFEQALRARLGDPAASAIARALRGAFDFTRTSAQRLAEDVADYARDESRAAVAGNELRAFHDDVDRVRDAGERLAARVAQLHTRLAERG
jgi:ubiquinone biosynthesis protein UbiJ